MNFLVVGGDSAEIFRQRAARHGQVEHRSGRKTRDLAKTIPKHTRASVVILDRIGHGLARKIRVEANRRGLPLLFQRQGGQDRTAAPDSLEMQQTRNDREM